MAAKTSIEWTEFVWNPLRGCSRISEGCRNCYAERIAARFSDEGMPFEGYARRTKDGPRWTGAVDLLEESLLTPLSWRRPKWVFVNSMSDLFHEDLPDGVIDRVFDVMKRTPQHTYQVLTKRAQRMRAWIRSRYKDSMDIPGNIWLGASVENQKCLDDRVPNVIETHARVRWLSLEPLLEEVIFPRSWLKQLDWVVVGGESGPGARPFNVEWARQVIHQCRDAGTKVFVKQLGARPFVGEVRQSVSESGRLPGGGKYSFKMARFESEQTLSLQSKKGGDPSEWPSDVRIRQMPEASR